MRPASVSDVRDVQRRVLRPDGPLPGDTEHPADWRHVAAEVDGRVVGACSIGPAPWEHDEVAALAAPTWQLRSMAVLPDFRGGVGARLLETAVTTARDAGAGSLWANARVVAVNLYLRAGWRVVGQPWDKPGIGPHRYLVRDLAGADHARPFQESTGVDLY